MSWSTATLWARQELLGPVIRTLRPVVYLLAFVWRRVLVRTTFVAVTGSLGKTTTKEMLAAILATRARTFRSWRNQNAGVLLPLNILQVRPWHRFAVLEVAAAAPNTMRRAARLVKPDVALVLGVLKTHSTAFRDLDEHAAEKALLLDALRPGGLAILNGDDVLVARMAGRVRGTVRLVGSSPAHDVWADQAVGGWPGRLALRVHAGRQRCTAETQLVGTHWVPAVLAALAAAHSLGIGLGDAAGALRSVEPFPARLQPVRLPGGAIVLRDDYNASIDAIEASLRVLAEAQADRRVLVITDFSDFGRNRKQRLKFLGARVFGVADVLVLIGEEHQYGCRRAVEGGMAPEGTHGFASLREAAEFLTTELRSGDLVLLKGRTTDHAARIFFAQLGTVRCWKTHCPKTMLCDICWELGLPPRVARRAPIVPPPAGPPPPSRADLADRTRNRDTSSRG